ncbi:MAG: hypothetical protein KC776_24825 [Myxococcales bacterium]|nr:hypothetical protein [Myxococcales bacterium]MCB9579733.1 hypothetical protein [Polyangiaceae bacterium]
MRTPRLGGLWAVASCALLVCSTTTAFAADRQGDPPGIRPTGPPPRTLTEPMLGPYVRPPYAPLEDEELRDESEQKDHPGPRHHGGFYLRFGGGIGMGSDGIQSSDSFDSLRTGEKTSFDARASGFAAATEIAFGGTPFRGVVLGAGVYTATLPAASADASDIAAGSYEYEVSQLALFSPLIDVYPWPTRGLHFQGGFGFGTLVMGQGFPKTGPDARAHTAVGPGFMLGVGHEWFVADEWSLGLLARVLYAWTDGDDPEGVTWQHHTVAPALLLTVTYH